MKTTHQTQHFIALEYIQAARTTRAGRNLWLALRRLELRASRAATAQCNGEAYQGQPYRDEAAWEAFETGILDHVERILGGRPSGLFFNTDPRGYALKIEGEIPAGMHKDWGGYGILAPKFD